MSEQAIITWLRERANFYFSDGRTDTGVQVYLAKKYLDYKYSSDGRVMARTVSGLDLTVVIIRDFSADPGNAYIDTTEFETMLWQHKPDFCRRIYATDAYIGYDPFQQPAFIITVKAEGKM